jgi:cation diffusion facilitator family transporter
MSTHAGALLIAALAYTYARRHANDERFAFGTGKFGDLAAFTSAIILAMIALLIGWGSIGRLLQPVNIAFDEAIPVAILGLGVNLASAYLLRGDHAHGAHHTRAQHEHAHQHHNHRYNAHGDDEHTHREHRNEDHVQDHLHAHGRTAGVHKDLNLRAAYVHVLADAFVSVLAILGLLAGRQLGLLWMDPLMGLIGACVIANWSWGLVRAAGAVLLDLRPDPNLTAEIRKRLEDGDDRVFDLHLWQIGPGHSAAVVSLVSDRPESPVSYKARLNDLPGLSHVTIEVLTCPGH